MICLECLVEKTVSMNFSFTFSAPRTIAFISLLVSFVPARYWSSPYKFWEFFQLSLGFDCYEKDELDSSASLTEKQLPLSFEKDR